jgi:hypothetical protein
MKQPGEEYLGDGVFASFDGYQIKLRTPRQYGDHIVYLDQRTLDALLEYMQEQCLIDATGKK